MIFKTSDNAEFFGFETSNTEGVITNVKVLSYSPSDLYKAKYDFTN